VPSTPACANPSSQTHQSLKPGPDRAPVLSQILDKDQDGRVTAEDVAALAVKFLCGEMFELRRLTPEAKEKLDEARRIFSSHAKDGYLFKAGFDKALA
jgi:hypothetical protein